MKTHINMQRLTSIVTIFFAVCMLLPLIALACHDGCSGSLSCSCDSYGQSAYYTQSAYYGQSGYYAQSGYYNQSGYYAQGSYYLQGGYWAAISQAWVRVSPATAHYGEAVTVSWDGGNAASCTLSGAGLSSTDIAGTTTIPSVTGEAVITIECALGPNTSIGTTSLKVLPSVIEAAAPSSLFDMLKTQVASVITWLMSTLT